MQCTPGMLGLAHGPFLPSLPEEMNTWISAVRLSSPRQKPNKPSVAGQGCQNFCFVLIAICNWYEAYEPVVSLGFPFQMNTCEHQNQSIGERGEKG